MSHPHRAHDPGGGFDARPPGWRGTPYVRERDESDSDTLRMVAPRQVEPSWFADDLDADLERERRRSRLGTLLVGALAVATVAVGLGLWTAADDVELAPTEAWSPPAERLMVDDFLAIPVVEPPPAPDYARAGLGVEAEGDGEAADEQATQTPPPAATPPVRPQTRVDPERARSIERTNAATDALNRYELSKFLGEPDPLSTVEDPELREAIQSVRGED